MMRHLCKTSSRRALISLWSRASSPMMSSYPVGSRATSAPFLISSLYSSSPLSRMNSSTARSSARRGMPDKGFSIL